MSLEDEVERLMNATLIMNPEAILSGAAPDGIGVTLTLEQRLNLMMGLIGDVRAGVRRLAQHLDEMDTD